MNPCLRKTGTLAPLLLIGAFSACGDGGVQPEPIT